MDVTRNSPARTVTLDGLRNVGKTTASRRLAEIYARRGHHAVALSSGSFYRAIAYLGLLDRPFEAVSAGELIELARKAELTIVDGQPVARLGGVTQTFSDVALKNPLVDHASAVHNQDPALRAYLNGLMGDYCARADGLILSDGRDMATVLGSLDPANLIKFYLVAPDRSGHYDRDAAITFRDPGAIEVNSNEFGISETLQVLDRHITAQFRDLAPGPIAVYGPSLVGKSTVTKALLKLLPQLAVVRSYTTRPPSERDFKYNYVTPEQFELFWADGLISERNPYAGHWYGSEVIGDNDRWRVLDIDLYGARAIKKQHPDTIMVKLLPPGDTMEERLSVLRDRAAADPAERNNLDERMAAARVEMSGEFDLEIVNGLEGAQAAARQIARSI